MLRLLLACGVISLGGCTFYTACPTGNGNDNPSNNNGGSSNGSGGSSNGGSSKGGNSKGGESSVVTTTGGEAPSGEWVNVTSNLAGLQSECGNMSYVSAKPDEDYLIAGVAARGLWRSTDGGETWVALDDKKNEQLNNRTTSIIYDPSDPNTMWECGNYGNAGGVYRSTDGGRSFQQLGKIIHNELVSIDFDDPDRKTLLAGGHEQAKTLYLSTDGGMNWQTLGDKVPGEAGVSSYPLVMDSQHFFLGVGGYGEGVSGIYRSDDQGETWNLVVKDVAGFREPLVASDRTIYWPAPFNAGIGKSTDDGETWKVLPAGGELLSVTPIELPDGRIAALRKRDVVVSADAGETWRVVSSGFDVDAVGLTYSKQRKAFYIWHWDCTMVVPDDGILRYDWDYEAE